MLKNLNIMKVFYWFGRLSWKVKLLIILFVAVFAWQLVVRLQKKPQAASFQTAAVERQDVIETVSESGNVSSNLTNIYSPTNGVITQVYVKNNDQVSIGQDLFSVSSTATEA